MPNLVEGMSKRERAILLGSALLILICFLTINLYDVIGNDSTDGQQLGYVSELSNDIRHKDGGKVFWSTAKKNQRIKSGDKVFTGQSSSAKIILKNKSSFQIAENSLVEFREIKKEKLADFSIGDFTLSVKGHIKVMINGKIAELQGDDSQIKLSIDKKKNITFKVLKGETNISFKETVYSLNDRRPTAEFTTDPTAPILEAETSPRKPTAIMPSNFDHILGLYDIYEKKGSALAYRTKNINLLNKKIELSIDGIAPSESVFIEQASNSSFIDSQKHHISASDIFLTKVFVGQNYWRYSPDREKWSTTMKFDVNTRLLPSSQPHVISKNTIPFANSIGKAQFDVTTSLPTTGFVVEYSANQDFPASQTKLFFFYNHRVTLQFNKPGNYFARFRAVDKDLRLGEWSDVKMVSVTKAADVLPPRWVKNTYESMTDEKFTLTWKKQKNVKSFALNILDATKNIFYKTVTPDSSIEWSAPRGGIYFAELTAIDKYDRKSPPSALAKIKIESPLLQLTKKSRPKRMLTSTDLSSAISVDNEVPNKIYIHSTTSVATAFYTFQSAAQAPTSDASTSPGIVANLLVWMNNHGFEGIGQKNIPSSGTPSTASADILSAEVRYRYRITPSEMAYFRAFQTSVFAGYEMYRNSDATFFLEKYSLFKVGLVLDIPIFERWLMASHLAYGTGSSTTKYEASVNFDYFFKRNWSMGAGYRMNLLEMTNSSQFPTFAVFREGYTNGVFNVKYFF